MAVVGLVVCGAFCCCSFRCFFLGVWLGAVLGVCAFFFVVFVWRVWVLVTFSVVCGSFWFFWLCFFGFVGICGLVVWISVFLMLLFVCCFLGAWGWVVYFVRVCGCFALVLLSCVWWGCGCFVGCSMVLVRLL